MKNLRLLFFASFLGCFVPVLSYAQGVFIPPRVVTGTVNGVTRPIAGATITVCAFNTAGIPCSPALANTVFKDSGLTVPLSNPFTTDANGNYPQAAMAGGIYTITETAPGFAGFSYQASVSCAPGAGCTVTTFAASSATITGALTAGSLNNILYVNSATAGADWCAKVNTVLLTVPAAGATVDASALTGAQACASNPFAGVTSPFFLKIGAATITVTASWSQPANSAVWGIPGSATGLKSIIQAGYSSSITNCSLGVNTCDLWLVNGGNVEIAYVQVIGNANVARLINAQAQNNIRIHNNYLSTAGMLPSFGPVAGIAVGGGATDVWVTDNISTAIGPSTVNQATSDITATTAVAGNTRMHFQRNQVFSSNSNFSISCFDCVDGDIVNNQIDENNKIRSDTLTSGGYGVLTYNLNVRDNRMLIEGNKVINSAGSGLYVQTCDSCTIANNQSKTCCQQETDGSLGVGGVSLNDVYKSSVTGNTVLAPSKDCYTITTDGSPAGDSLELIGNTCYGTGSLGTPQHGVNIRGTISNLDISHNILSSMTKGIYVNSTGSSTCTNCTFAYNTITSPTSNAIEFFKLVDAKVNGNTITGMAASQVGILLNQHSSSNVTIASNDINCGGAGSSVGIDAAAAVLNISGGTIQQCPTGMFVDSTATNATVNGVTIGNGVTTGINSASATPPTLIYGNNITATTPINSAASDIKWGNELNGALFFPTSNTVRISGTDFTSANSAALQAITGLSYTFSATASNVGFHCALMFSQATAVAGDQFGIGVITTAPTSASAFSTVNTNATTVQYGVLTALASTTPTAVVTFTPAVTTVLGAVLDGTIEVSASGVSTFNVYVLNGTAADVIVVKKDSYCTIYPIQ